MAYVPATVAVKRPEAAVNVMPDETFTVPVALIKASTAAKDEAESVVRVKLIN
jgi:hypothetical protein